MPDEPKPPVISNPSPTPSPKLADANKKSAPALSPDAVSRSESKATQFFRSFLRWAGIALVVFGLGALAAIFLFYIPKSNDLKQTAQEFATANAKISALQTEITTLENRIAELSTLEAANQGLQTDLEMAQLHAHLLDALVDVRAAQYALAQDDPASASEQLATTAATLTEMQKLLEAEQAQSVDTMLSRLELAQGGLDSDPFAAQSDLEVLATRLLQLEEATFNEP